MRAEVRYTVEAEEDLRAIHAYVRETRSLEDADRLLDRFLDQIATLEHAPLRGAVPKELDEAGQPDFRQVLLRPYRIFYQVIGEVVEVVLITDGRRDMQALLAQRLLRR